MITITIQRPRTTLDLLLWRQHGIGGREMLTETLDLNPRVASLGAELPLGAIVHLPERPAARPGPAITVIDLFGES